MAVSFEVSGEIYTLPQEQATLLAENLRGHAAGNFPDDDQFIASLGAAPGWKEGTLAAADFIEDVLCGRATEPIGLERGKGAGAIYWVLRLMMDLRPDPKGAEGLKGALARLLADHQLDDLVLVALLEARVAHESHKADSGYLTSSALAGKLQVRVEDVNDRLHLLALEGRVRESEVKPNCWSIVRAGD